MNETEFADVKEEIGRRPELQSEFADSHIALLRLSHPESCFKAEVNGALLYLPRDAFLDNQHCILGMHGIVVAPLCLKVELDEVEWIASHMKLGATFVDVGAMLGVISLPVSRCHGGEVGVVAFEPARRSFDNLRRAVEVNGIRNIEIIGSAVSDQAGSVLFAEAPAYDGVGAPWHSQTSSIAHSGVVAGSTTYEVNTVTLDDFFSGRDDRKSIGVLKIDVEGFEIDVLHGAERLLSDLRPHMVIDIHTHPFRPDTTTEQPVRDILSPLGYALEMAGHAMLCEPR
jgi:FkbM family methyltransferase